MYSQTAVVTKQSVFFAGILKLLSALIFFAYNKNTYKVFYFFVSILLFLLTKSLLFTLLFALFYDFKKSHLHSGLSILSAVFTGFLLGRFVTHRHLEIKENACKAEVAHRSKNHINAAEYLEKRIQRHHIKEFYDAITDGPKGAGIGSTNFQQAVKLRKHFSDSGFTSVSSLTPSQVLLTYHDPENPTTVELQNNIGNMKHKITVDTTRRFSLPYKAQVTELKRTIRAPPMFVNFGSKQDYDFLESRNISIKNHILLMKMKKSALFKQISEGIKKGALGVLLYADPSHHFELQEQTETVKELNPTILGRLQLAFGDPFCANHSNTTQDSQRSIMVNVVSFNEMQNIFKVMSLNASSKSWASFMKSSSSSMNENKWHITMSSPTLNLMHTYYNVIAALEGAEEPDRYILIGSNRESLSNSDDPLGGTVAMMEISRVFGELNRVKGWIPRRTVIFCSWGLQGDGHFNSESWAQLLHPLLTERAVAYLSVEVAVRGNSTLKIQSAPILETVIEEASMLVPNFDPEEQNAHRFTLGDTMQHMAKTRNASVIDIIHGEGDYQMFLFEQGIPSLDFGFDGEGRFTDSTFSYHRAITELWAILIWSLADDPVLPLNPEGYSKFLMKSFFVVQKVYTTLIEKHLSLFNRLHNAIMSFNETASDFGKKVHDIDKTDCMRMRVVNDQLVRLEKQMLCFPEMQNQGAHPLLTEGSIPSVGFGVLQDLLEESFMWPESTTVQRQIQQELTMLSACIQNGELLLKDVVGTLTQIQT